jgi:ribonuclease HI
MNITITTDASFSKEYNVGTYAFYITSNEGRCSMSGAFKKSCKTPSEAEIKCIINALTFISSQPSLLNKCKCIFINTDSMNAIHIFENDRHAIRKYKLNNIKYLQTSVKKVMKLYVGKEIHFRHVKAHKDTDTPRTWVNDFCDKAAKIEMGILINKITSK